VLATANYGATPSDPCGYQSGRSQITRPDRRIVDVASSEAPFV